MKNLIERIEELLETARNYYRNYSDRDILSETRGQIEAYQDCLNLLNQYNLITAPKSIKLSELIDKIYETKFKSESWVEPIKEGDNYYRIRVQYGDGYWGDYEFYIVDGKISSAFDMELPRDEFKWLYEIWIAETTIIDDLECDE